MSHRYRRVTVKHIFVCEGGEDTETVLRIKVQLSLKEFECESFRIEMWVSLVI